jgi:exodeoxyribonuclease VII large subunit
VFHIKDRFPKYPKRIGVITSPTGAVIEDIKNTVSRRYLLTEIYLYPALVQGPGSADSIRNMILLANQ